MELKKAIFADLYPYKNSQYIHLPWILFLNRSLYIIDRKICTNILYTLDNMLNVFIL